MKVHSFLFLSVLIGNPALSEEIAVRSVNLPAASMDQEITYSTSERDYNQVRDSILARLRANDPSAMMNPKDGPTMIVETTAKLGIEYKGGGTAKGRKHLRKITAAEEALFIFETE